MSTAFWVIKLQYGALCNYFIELRVSGYEEVGLVVTPRPPQKTENGGFWIAQLVGLYGLKVVGNGCSPTYSVRAELVEAPSFSLETWAEEGQPFDVLRANGWLGNGSFVVGPGLSVVEPRNQHPPTTALLWEADAMAFAPETGGTLANRKRTPLRRCRLPKSH